MSAPQRRKSGDNPSICLLVLSISDYNAGTNFWEGPMESDGINRRKFLGRGAAVGLGVLAHPAFNGRVFGANDGLTMGLIGGGGRGRGAMEGFSGPGAEWEAGCVG